MFVTFIATRYPFEFYAFVIDFPKKSLCKYECIRKSERHMYGFSQKATRTQSSENSNYVPNRFNSIFLPEIQAHCTAIIGHGL